MNQHPKDWNEAAVWAVNGELENDTPCSWRHTALLDVSRPLTNYRRKPRVPLEFWSAVFPRFDTGKEGLVLSISHGYNSQENCFVVTQSKDIRHFREVVELPPLTEEEVLKIHEDWQRVRIGKTGDWVRFAHAELKKLGRAL